MDGGERVGWGNDVVSFWLKILRSFGPSTWSALNLKFHLKFIHAVFESF